MKRLLALMLSFLMLVSVGVPVQAEELTNVALGKTVTVSGSEAAQFNGSKLVDGIIDNTGTRPGASRWASDTGLGKKWVEIDLGKDYEISSLVLEWERRNSDDYSILTAVDGGEFQVLEERDSFPVEQRDEFNFTTITARKVRLNIDSFVSDSEGVDWPTVSLYEIEVYGEDPGQTPDPEPTGNLALNKSASSSDNEAPVFSADKAFDGVIDRDKQRKSRWASNTNDGVKWLQVDLGSKLKLRSFFIDWERRNATDFEILVSDNGVDFTSVVHRTESSSTFRERIILDEEVQGQFVRLKINEYDAQSEGINWNSVSVYEFEMYSELIPLSPEEIVQGIQMPEQTINDDVLVLPSSEDFTAELMGSQNKYIVDEDGNVGRPLSDKVVKVDLNITIDGKTYELLDREVLIPGLHNPSESINEQPVVVPELEEWFGLEGSITIDEDSKVMVSSSLPASYKEGVQDFILDFEDLFGYSLDLVTGDSPSEKDFYFFEAPTKGLGKEGYLIELDQGVKVSSNHETGMYWSTRTILQSLVEGDMVLNKGLIRDYPKWDLRGFMLDVGRKTFTMDFLNDLSQQMSWYKLNDFHIHLNDNFIFLEDYTAKGLNPMDAYSGFRLESSVPNLTSDDLYYTKDEFRDFMETSKSRGVNIVPEIDVPAHSLALTQARPDLAYGSVGREADHLDLNNRETLPFVKGIFEEYMTGDNPLFTEDTVVHVGTDEYDARFAEEFRKFTDDMLGFIQDDHNRTVRLWGSLTARSGSTPVRAKNVQMNIWNTGWSNPKEMFDQGFELINSLDGQVYIVPDAGYYHDYLNIQNLYNSWEANNFGGTIIPASSPQMLGGIFALWNDQIDLRNNGISEIDAYDRIDHAMPTMASKLWGTSGEISFDQFQDNTQAVGKAPRTNLRHEVQSVAEEVVTYDFEQSETLDHSGNNYDIVSKENVSFNDALVLKGGKSFVETPLTDVALGNKIEFSVKQSATASDDSEQVLFEHGITQIKASQNKSGKLGFSREGLDYAFNYELPKDEWVDVSITTSMGKASLHVNGKFVQEIKRVRGISNTYQSMNASLLIPIERIGSLTDAFEGEIANVSILDANAINTSKLRNLIKEADMVNEEAYTETSISNLSDALASAKLLLENKEVTQEVVDAEILLLQDAINNLEEKVAEADKSKLQEKLTEAKAKDEKDFTTSSYAALSKAITSAQTLIEKNDATQEEIDTEVQSLQKALDGLEIFELNQASLDMAISLAQSKVEKDYTPKTWKNFKTILDQVMADYSSYETQEEVNDAKASLEKAMEALVEKEVVDRTKLETAIKAANDIDMSNYTQESAKVLKQVIKDSEKLLAKEDASQKEVDAQMDALLLAVNNLEELEEETVDTSKLETLVDKLEKHKLDPYTKDSVDAFNKILKESKNLLSQKDASQAEIDAQFELLEKAFKNLEKVVVIEPKPEEDQGGLPSTGMAPSLVLPGLGIATSLAGVYLVLKKKKN